MKPIKQIAVNDNQLFALDTNGVVWLHVAVEGTDKWHPIPGPPDGDPFFDSRDKFDKFEDEVTQSAPEQE